MVKHFFFWIGFVLCSPLFIIGATMSSIGEWLTERCHKYEDWYWGYTKDGWQHRGNGLYYKGPDDHT